ncbi:glyoxalase [Antarcticibacterium flavum]|uniref:Glyoxalase n=1 Tax=Antarcticibacterium flavum TaxID=2058175 RepID=A0A5B7WY30_9FLAO|nr:MULTISPECIES: glyoxalase [Antarcticibacterium]MCM4161833.1 glyoxalase [Antarcticibacterium sp. W02-3]QCY67950.1 glyoxalase [Antarcticibacterium flavum]
MNQRDQNLLRLRPEIPNAKVSSNMSRDEQFQNRTLRPVTKLQDGLLVEVFRNYIYKHKNTFYGFNVEKKMGFIENAIQRDIKFRNSLKGIIIGQFTLDEYEIYIQNSSSLNKRMMNIVKERLLGNLQLLEDQSLYKKA